MGRFGKLLAVLMPAAFAGSATAVTVDTGASTQIAQDGTAAGSYEALTSVLITNPDSPEAALARDALIRGTGASTPAPETGPAALLAQACDGVCPPDGYVP